MLIPSLFLFSVLIVVVLPCEINFCISNMDFNHSFFYRFLYFLTFGQYDPGLSNPCRVIVKLTLCKWKMIESDLHTMVKSYVELYFHAEKFDSSSVIGGIIGSYAYFTVEILNF